ncbi:MAG: rod shape-determining protein MreC [Alphaproteobacteria bacterium]|nr:rod shape-determining protein MreC [Alphaproteobacteria bacterium]
MSTVNQKQPRAERSDAAHSTQRLRSAFPILILVSLGLLVLSRLEHKVIDQMRWHVTEVMTPVLNALLIPVEPLRWAKRQAKEQWQMSEALVRLKQENGKLRNWQWRAIELQRKVDTLSGLVRVVEDADYKFVTARVMANSSGAFVRSVLINAGRQQNVRLGYPVVNEEGLVGRIVDSGDSAARVLLLADLNSRVPVRVGKQGTRAILVGDNGPNPRLDYLPANATVSPGDLVATSGAGGLYPSGLRVGVVVKDRRGLRVWPKANLDQLEYLSVLFYASPRLEMTDRATSRKDARLVGQRKFKLQSPDRTAEP